MMQGRPEGDQALSPSSEEIHLPGPSYAPVVTAAGVTIALVGVIFSFVFTAIGVLIFLVPVIRWIRDVREEWSALPPEQ